MRQWFDQGYESFTRGYPDVAATVAYRPFYVCPQCLKAFPEAALESGWLTKEDVPPKSVGGRKIVLTCRACNNEAGHGMDDDMRLEADILDFFGKRLTEIPATLRTESGKVPIRLSAEGGGVRMFAVPTAAHPADNRAITADFNRATEPDGWRDLTMKIQFKPYSPARAEASWLRSAYLAFFTALGYRFVLRRELDVVRQRIADPNTRAFTFRIVLPQPVREPLLAVINTPEVFRSFAMMFDQHVVFLPLYGDADLYSRLAKQPAGNVDLTTAGAYTFPDRPLFLDDRPIRAVSMTARARREL